MSFVRLFKYKSLENLDHVLDILENERIYCAKYCQLNDPFEGILGLSIAKKGMNAKELSKLSDFYKVHKDELHRYNICSFSATNDNVLMWAHYADSFRGVCIEIELPVDHPNLYKVEYVDNKSSLEVVEPKDLLRYKMADWAYEREFRIITEGERYFDIKGMIKSVCLGCETHNSKDDYRWLLEAKKRLGGEKRTAKS